MFPDYSGKYHGKLNDKENSNDGKISNKCNGRKKGVNREIIRIKREKITGKIMIRTCAKTWIRVRHVKIIKDSFCTKKPSPTC